VTVECGNEFSYSQATFPIATDLCDATVTKYQVKWRFCSDLNLVRMLELTNIWTVADDCGNTSGDLYSNHYHSKIQQRLLGSTAATALNTTVEW
jgi:hypothetical protein